MAEEEIKQEEKEIKKEWIPEETKEQPQEFISADLTKQFLPYEIAKKLKFGEGANTIKVDNLYGLWAGNQIYSISPFRVSSGGSVRMRALMLQNASATPASGTIGELAVANGSLYLCTSSSPLIWKGVA